MNDKITSLFRKAYNKLLRRKDHRAIWSQKFDGVLNETLELDNRPRTITKKWDAIL